jgi:hypothetical protein
MKTLFRFCIAAITGISIYLALFVFIVHKPLTIGVRKDYYDYKVNYLYGLASIPKIAIFAGSNGRYSHRCETIAKLTGFSCANLSVASGARLKWEFERYKPYFKPGDVLYLPLEYGTPTGPSIGNEGPYMVAYDRSALFDIYTPHQSLQAVFYFDLRFLLSGIGEMALSTMGKHARSTVATLTTQGDERGHSRAKGVPYRQYIADLPNLAVSAEAYQSERGWGDVRDILEWGRATGVTIIGGLPTTPEDSSIPEESIRFLRKFYQAHGHCFLTLPNNSRYPRSNFYDSPYHLNEETQIMHSASLGPYLASAIKSGKCP